MAGFPVGWRDEATKCWNTEILFPESFCPDVPLWHRPKAAVNVGWAEGLVDSPPLSPWASLPSSVSLSGLWLAGHSSCLRALSLFLRQQLPPLLFIQHHFPHPVSLQTSAEVSGLLLTPFPVLMVAEQGEAVCRFLSLAGAFEPWPQATTYQISDLGQVT